ncbi:hypothetical protein K0M31_015797 [Melipona bicolor]|uniref:Uncharacterized protein n=1 Tax=Melipona bicolor TaxID=60889 RepID=A0AA40KEX0_9HYME|nr:hypothetical protein K0M31_015797 [Melipona bicolor]
MTRSIIKELCSGAEHNTSRRALRLGSRNTLSCPEVPNAMAFSHLRSLYLALRNRISKQSL